MEFFMWVIVGYFFASTVIQTICAIQGHPIINQPSSYVPGAVISAIILTAALFMVV